MEKFLLGIVVFGAIGYLGYYFKSSIKKAENGECSCAGNCSSCSVSSCIGTENIKKGG